MHARIPMTIGGIAGGSILFILSMALLQGHFQALKDVRGYALPLAAEIPPLERRLVLLSRQIELSAIENSLRTGSAEEKLHAYVLPQGNDLKRLLAFVESSLTFLERRKLLKTTSPIDVEDLEDTVSADMATGYAPLQVRTLRFSATLLPEGREQLSQILELSGMLTVGDALSPEDIKTLFGLTEAQNYAGIVPVEQFLSSDLQSYVNDPTIPEMRLRQEMPSEEFLSVFQSILDRSRLQQIRVFLEGDFGRTLAAQKLWPVQFMTIDKESIEELPDGWENVEFTIKAYSRGQRR